MTETISITPDLTASFDIPRKYFVKVEGKSVSVEDYWRLSNKGDDEPLYLLVTLKLEKPSRAVVIQNATK